MRNRSSPWKIIWIRPYGSALAGTKGTVQGDSGKENCDEAISGMALGTDMVFALAALELKQEGFPIKLHCAIPCRDHNSRWTKESVILYNEILRKADVVKLVSDQAYVPWVMQTRNEYMVDLADAVIAVWDGSKSGTGRCVEYAEKRNKRVIRIDP